jgi:hypothetical protein
MSQVFQDDGVALQFPDDWSLEREDNESGWTVSLQSPDTAFFLLTYDRNTPTPQEMAETALEALREEYDDLEAEACVDSVAGQPSIGHDIHFISLDLTNTCWTRSFYGAGGTLFFLCQLTDQELETREPELLAISASLVVED